MREFEETAKQMGTIQARKQVVMPTHQDLENSKRYGLQILTSSPYAVYVKKISAKHRDTITASANIKTEQEFISDLHKKYHYDFLVDFQVNDGLVFRKSEMDFMEQIQQVKELNRLCMYEKSSKQSASDFEIQLQGWQKRNPGKQIVPVSEVYTADVIQKVAMAKKLGIKQYAVKFRSYKKYSSELNTFLSLLQRGGLYSIVFGICPTKHRGSGATMLLPALWYGVDAASRWIAWSGRETPMRLVCEDWVYKLVTQATVGATNYSGRNRLQVLSGKTTTTFNTAFEKIDTINQVTAMMAAIRSLTKVQFVGLFK